MLLTVKPKPHYCRALRELFQGKALFSQKAEYIFHNPKDEYSEVPQYPPIEPVTKEYLEYKEKKDWYDKIKRQKTVEEKLFVTNIPRYWGWKCLMLKEGEIPYNSIDFFKHITRTHLIETERLPAHYQMSSYPCLQLAFSLAKQLQELIEDHEHEIRHNCELRNSDPDICQREITSTFINKLNRLILKNLQKNHSDLLNVQIDYSPRQESFWNLGSLTETYKPEEYPEGLPSNEIPEEYLGRPSNKYIQYIGKPIIQLRSINPITPIADCGNFLYLEYPVPIYEYDPFIVFGFEMDRRHVTSIPGFWPGDPREFSFLSYHDTNYVTNRPETYGMEDAKETVQCQAMLSSFSWLMSLAAYQGFTTFHDVTYPFVTQTVLTNGKEFTFAVYQLNTSELYHEDPLYNPKCNMCWITPTMTLYDVTDGEITDLNVQVLKLLLQFYTCSFEDVNKRMRKPYLDANLGVVAKYEDEEKREWLERQFKYFSSNRPRSRVDKMYEPTEYERIFKMQFRMMPRDKLFRPFEVGTNPYLRKMSDHVPEYIPKALRPDKHLPKYKQQKFRKTFYPE